MKRILLICAFLLALAVQAGAQSKQQQQQPVEVNGLVVDSDDVPIVGATVYIKDEPGIGSITNSEGRFKLTAKLYNTLAVSFMGYETAEQIITSAADVKITLREGNQMEEVVVIGMGTQRKVSVTGAVAVVDTKDLELPATNIVNTLGGRVPGVISIQSSGEPGRNISEFWVRGIGTFGANSGALVLIDGLEGNLSQIDPADVESFSVLKDAAATAVYGSRGANGVVLVTTKRGKQEQLKITFRSNYTISELRRLPRYVGATQYAEMANEAAVASGMSPIYNDTQMDIIRYGLDPDLYPDIDWQDVILNPTSFQHTQYVSAQGGGNIARYFASLGMSQESSAYKSMDDSKYNKGVGYDTYNFRTNIDINLTKTTQIYLGAMGFMSVNKRPSMEVQPHRHVAHRLDLGFAVQDDPADVPAALFERRAARLGFGQRHPAPRAAQLHGQHRGEQKPHALQHRHKTGFVDAHRRAEHRGHRFVGFPVALRRKPLLHAGPLPGTRA